MALLPPSGSHSFPSARRKRLRLLPSLSVVVLGLAVTACLWSVEAQMSKDEFRSCIDRCGEQFKKCIAQHQYLWDDYLKNRMKIMRALNDCCLKGEDDYTMGPSTSFATCARDRCYAQQWGCQAKKNHTGFLSPEEEDRIRGRRRP